MIEWLVTPAAQAAFLFAGLFGLSSALTALMIRINIADIPNARSAHRLPTPKSGGLAIAAAFVVGLGIISQQTALFAFNTDEWRLLSVIFALILGFSLLDDLRTMAPPLKLVMQLVCAALFAAFLQSFKTLPLPMIGEIALGPLAVPLSILWIAGMMNVMNFMDGLNGMASGGVLAGSLAFGLIAFMIGATAPALVCLCLFAGALGFFVFNFPGGRIFMGETGSQFLGFALAALAILAAQPGSGNIPALIMPAVMFVFLFDVAATAAYRLWRGHSLFVAHREHGYQLLNRLGLSHMQTGLIYLLAFIPNGLAAALIANAAPNTGLLVLLGQALIHILALFYIWRLSHRRGLLTDNRQGRA